jgi:hypothetical protein
MCAGYTFAIDRDVHPVYMSVHGSRATRGKQMTKAETTFLTRMVPHMIAGLSLEEAGRAVLADDERIWLAATEKSEQGEYIRSELCREVYAKLTA